MRITHVITRLIVGGAQENTVASVAGLRAKPGLDVDLISGPTSGAEGSLHPWIEQRCIPLTTLPDLIRPLHPWRDLRCLLSLTRHFRTAQPDLVHTHSGKAGILGRWAARRAGVPLIVHTIHGPSFGPFQGAGANLAFTRAERFAGRFTDHFVAVCDAMIEQYLAAGIGRRSDYTRVWSGFDLDPFLQVTSQRTARARLGLAESDFVIGLVARLAPLKGHDDLLEMWPQLIQGCPQAKVLLVGDGPLRSRIEARTQRLGISERIRFAGLVAPGEVPDHLGAMDVVLHLSRREGLARALTQALAAGRPVVAFDCDGAREVCLDGQTGFSIPPGDICKAAERLIQLSRDPELGRQMGLRGRELIRESFSTGQMVDHLQRLYEKLAGDRGLRSIQPRAETERRPG